jgi:hypothetical protein
LIAVGVENSNPADIVAVALDHNHWCPIVAPLSPGSQPLHARYDREQVSVSTADDYERVLESARETLASSLNVLLDMPEAQRAAEIRQEKLRRVPGTVTAEPVKQKTLHLRLKKTETSEELTAEGT